MQDHLAAILMPTTGLIGNTRNTSRHGNVRQNLSFCDGASAGRS
jgi:hypothetical protein